MLSFTKCKDVNGASEGNARGLWGKDEFNGLLQNL